MERGKEHFSRWLNEWLRNIPKGDVLDVSGGEVTTRLAASHCRVSLEQIEEYVREGLLPRKQRFKQFWTRVLHRS